MEPSSSSTDVENPTNWEALLDQNPETLEAMFSLDQSLDLELDFVTETEENKGTKTEEDFSRLFSEGLMDEFLSTVREGLEKIETGETNQNPNPTPNPNFKKWIPRKRLKKNSVEYRLKQEERKIKNRIASARSFAKSKAYIKELELKVAKLREENTFRIKLLREIQVGVPIGNTCNELIAPGLSEFSAW